MGKIPNKKKISGKNSFLGVFFEFSFFFFFYFKKQNRKKFRARKKPAKKFNTSKGRFLGVKKKIFGQNPKPPGKKQGFFFFQRDFFLGPWPRRDCFSRFNISRAKYPGWVGPGFFKAAQKKNAFFNREFRINRFGGKKKTNFCTFQKRRRKKSKNEKAFLGGFFWKSFKHFFGGKQAILLSKNKFFGQPSPSFWDWVWPHRPFFF